MYRCTECNEEFEIKPDFCKCGNDIFEKFTPNITKTTVEKVSGDEKFKSSLPIERILSIGFLIICIITAIIPWLIKDKRPAHKPAVKQEIVIEKEIPNIENIWNNNINTQTSPPPAEPIAVKVIDNTVKNQITPQKQKKSENTQATKKDTKKNVQNINPIQNKPIKTKPAAQTNQEIKLPPSVLNPSQTKPNPQPKPQMSRTEFQKYKGDIRSAFAARLNLTNVQGDGECGIEFSVDNTGKLINRKFIYKSENKTVNDEVYYMLMRMPNYKTPPAYYNGEKIRYKIYLNNTYYEISYI